MNIDTPDWVRDAIFYQIFPDRFARSSRYRNPQQLVNPKYLQNWGDEPTYHAFQGGNLAGIVEKFDYLNDLGITALYLNPIFASASNHRYHTFDYYTVDPILGTNADFADFLSIAHENGVKVILDGVFNHASRGFFQFNHLLENGRESPYVDWFHVNEWPINAFNEQMPPTYAAWWGAHALPKLNTHNPDVREFLWHVATYWLEKGIDGWRLDVPNEIDDDGFWQEFRHRCKSVNPEMYIVGELWDEAHRWLRGDQFDGQMNYMFTRACFGFFAGENMDQRDTVRCGYHYIPPLNGSDFAASLNHQFNQLYDPAIVFAQLNMLGSHDTPRLLTVTNNNKTAVRMMFLCQMTVPGAPNIYYGDEIGMEGRHDPDCRRAFPWQHQETWDLELRDYVKNLISWRKAIPALRRGTFKILFADEDIAVYQRACQGSTAVIAFNTNDQPRSFTLPEEVQAPLNNKFTPEKNIYKSGVEITLMGREGTLWSS